MSQQQTDEFPGYSYCESIAATGRSAWHIRKLTKHGRFLGGGIDSKSLCGRIERGWDLAPPVTKKALPLDHVCQKCQTALIELTK